MKVIIIGGGQVGRYLARLLKKNGEEITIIEDNKNQYKIIQEEFEEEDYLYGFGSDPKLLEEAGISDADVVTAVSESDEMNLVATTLAKVEYNVNRVIAKVNDPKNAWLYTKEMGVDVVVNQADIVTKMVLEEMDITHMFTLIELNRGKYEIVQLKVGSRAKALNQKIKDLSLPKETLIIALTREQEMTIPKGDTTIQAEDEMLILTMKETRGMIQALFN